MKISRGGKNINANKKKNKIIINSLLGSLVIARYNIHKKFSIL